MIVARDREALREGLRHVREEAGGGRLGLVPTMGFLHEGHLSLVDLAARSADAVAVSLFVNPLQFGPAEDLATYPRDEARDLALLEARGAALVFAPDVDGMYPAGEPLVTVSPGPMEEVLCGRHRPGHFRGVLTVVAKLFNLLRPDVAVFGRKDFQQSVLVRRMAADLDLGVEVEVGPIVREGDGLAMSSRNAYLTPEQRAQAPALYAALRRAARAWRAGERSAADLRDLLRDTVDAQPLLRTQYAEIVDPRTLEPVDRVRDDSVATLAAFCGDTRLIDNVVLGEAV